MKKIILISILALAYNVLSAQPHGKMNHDEIKSQKIAFFTDRLALTPDESQKFWPIYNKYWGELRGVAHSKRELIGKIKEVNGNSTFAKTYLDEYMSLMKKETTLTGKYIAEFEKIIPTYKVALIFVADEEFRRDLIKKLKNK